MKNHPRSHRFFPLFPIIAILFFSGVVMLLWNAIIPGLTGWALLTYWKAMGLLVLCKILFGGLPCRRGARGGPPWAHRHPRMRMAWWRNLSEEEREQWKERRREWKAKWQAMSAEDRIKMKRNWKGRCGSMQENWWPQDEGERPLSKGQPPSSAPGAREGSSEPNPPRP